MKDLIFFKNQDEFNDWLEQHSTINNEIWVWYFKKNTGYTSQTWSESVDVALCFWWIDGIRKSIDDKSYKIRFTPRRLNSVWSAVNVKKVKTLIPLGKMKPAGIHVFNNRSDKEGYTSDHRNIPISEKYEKQIKANKNARDFFTTLAPSYKRETIWWLMNAKKEETQLKRLAVIIESSELNEKIPMLRKKK